MSQPNSEAGRWHDGPARNDPTLSSPGSSPSAAEHGAAYSQDGYGRDGYGQPRPDAYDAQPYSPQSYGSAGHASANEPAPAQYGRDQYGRDQYGRDQYAQDREPRRDAPRQSWDEGPAARRDWDQRPAPYYDQYAGHYLAPQYGGQPSGPRRPALVTTAAVLGFVFSPVGFIAGVFGLFSMTLFTAGEFSFLNTSWLLGWTWTLCTLISGLLLFVGSVQAIGGRNPRLSAIACILYLIGQLVVPVSAHIQISSANVRSHSDGAAALSMSWTHFIISALLAALQVFLLYSSDARRWFAAKKREAGTL